MNKLLLSSVLAMSTFTAFAQNIRIGLSSPVVPIGSICLKLFHDKSFFGVNYAIVSHC